MHGGNINKQKLTAIMLDDIRIALGIMPVPESVLSRFSERMIESKTTDETLTKLATVVEYTVYDDQGKPIDGDLELHQLDHFTDSNITQRVPTMKENDELLDFLEDFHKSLTTEADKFDNLRDEMIDLVQEGNEEMKTKLERYLSAHIESLGETRFAEYIKKIKA